MPERDFLAELEAASKPARDLLREAGTYINYLRVVIRDMLPYFPKDHPYHVGFSEAAAAEGFVERDPELRDAVEALLHVSNDRKYCPLCTRMVKHYGHVAGCRIAALNKILNDRVPRTTDTR